MSLRDTEWDRSLAASEMRLEMEWVHACDSGEMMEGGS